MSTRGVVAVGSLRNWEGIYNHSDSYPGGLGREVFNLALIEFNRGQLGNFCRRLMNQTRWETFMDPTLQANAFGHITSRSPNPLHMEWVYVIDETQGALHVLASREVKGSLVKDPWPRPDPCPQRLKDGSWNYGNCSRYKHVKVCTLLFGVTGVIDWGMISRFKDGDDPFDPNLIFVPEPPPPEKRTAYDRILDDDMI